MTGNVTPPNGTLFLIGAGGSDVTFLNTDAGFYSTDPFSGGLDFDPNSGFSGTAPAVGYKITNQISQSSSSTYTVTVTKPAPPVAEPLTSSGGVGTQNADTSGISGNPIAEFIVDGSPADTVTILGTGTYRIFSGDGVSLDFTPGPCFAGPVPAVTYRLTDGYDQSSDSTYTAFVTNPSAPTADPLSSSGLGRTSQTVTVTQPSCVGSTSLLDGSTPVTSLTRSDGIYTIDPSTGVITYVPAIGYTGTALTPVAYRVTDQYSQSAEGTYTTTVSPALPPTSLPLVSTGVGTAIQSVTAIVPEAGRASLLDGVDPVAALTIAGQGTYVINSVSGVIAFAPAPTYQGTADPVHYIVTDAYGQTTTNTYTATVSPPDPPVAVPLTSTGVGAEVQSRTVAVPPGGGITFFTPQKLVPEIEVPSVGIFTVDGTTGVISFAPFPYFVGTPDPVIYLVIDAYNQTSSSTYTPTVTLPPAPTASPVTSTGVSGAVQQQTVPIPPGGSITLLNGTIPVTTLTIAGQGVYVLDPTTGVITFTPLVGFSGSPTPAVYQVTDVYGQTARATYAPAVGAVIVPTPVPTPVVVTAVVTPAATDLTDAGGGIPTSVPAGSGGQAAAVSSPTGSTGGQTMLAVLGFIVLTVSALTVRRRRGLR